MSAARKGSAPRRASAPKGRASPSKGRAGAPKGRASAPKGRATAPKGKGGPPKGRASGSKGGASGTKGKGAAAKGRSAERRPPSGPSGPKGRGGARPGPGRQAAARGLGGDQVEGRQAVRELLLAGNRRVREILIEEGMPHADILDDIRELAVDGRVSLQEVSAGRLRTMAKTEAPQGIVALAQELEETDIDDLARPGAFLLAFDGVTDPGNLGAALRSAEGAGVTGVVLPRHRAVHITPTVAKSAAGAIEHLPMALVGGMPAAIDRLKERGVWVIGLDAAADRTVHELDLGDEPVALVLGAEGPGLSRLVRQRCDVLARIPLRGHLSSLNVAAAAAVATFEVRRQRDRTR